MDYGTIAVICIQGVLVVLLTFNLRTGKDTNKEVSKINGNLGKLQVWADGHEKQDDDRWNQLTERRSNIRSELANILATVQKIDDKTG